MQYSTQFGKIARASALAGIALAGVVFAGCSGGDNRIDPKVPARAVRDIAGSWGVTAIANNERFVTCQDPNNILGGPVAELKDRNVVVASCGATDAFTFGPSDAAGNGTFTYESLGTVTEGSYFVEKDKLTLVPTRANGSVLSAPLPKSVYSLIDTSEGIELVPISQSAAYRLRASDLPKVDNTGRVLVDNLTPILNADGTVNTIILPNTDTVPIIQSDLTIHVGPSVDPADVTDTPGFAREYFVKRTLRKR